MIGILNKLQDTLDSCRAIDFLGPLALRLYLAPVFWVADTNKLSGFDDVVISNNGIEWAITYFVMLLALFFIGAGKYFSVDHWVAHAMRR